MRERQRMTTIEIVRRIWTADDPRVTRCLYVAALCFVCAIAQLVVPWPWSMLTILPVLAALPYLWIVTRGLRRQAEEDIRDG